MNAQFIELNNIDQLDELFEVSKRKPVMLFKHSTTCPISANIFEEISEVDSTIFLITIQKSRNISDEIEKITGIKHESPQAIILKDGKSVYHASHYDITAETLKTYLSNE
jgi:bacillithiol system protein YtxJ